MEDKFITYFTRFQYEYLTSYKEAYKGEMSTLINVSNDKKLFDIDDLKKEIYDSLNEQTICELALNNILENKKSVSISDLKEADDKHPLVITDIISINLI